MEEKETTLNLLYQEARKTLPEFRRRLRWSDIDYTMPTGPHSSSKSYLDGALNEFELDDASPDYLRKMGFSSKKPEIREFLRKSSIEREIGIFLEEFIREVLEIQNNLAAKAIREARERGIEDAESEARYRNRNNRYNGPNEGLD